MRRSLQMLSPGNTAFVVYRGPSRFEKAEKIMAIVTGVAREGTARGSNNGKTGAMAQLYILVANESPNAAKESGRDSAVCGRCELRTKVAKESGGMYCYVNTGFAPNTSWHAHAERPVEMEAAMAALARAGVALRLGAYGDPAALPEHIIAALAKAAKATTGYTHDWRYARSAWIKRYAMASCETETDAVVARMAGWRTFRIVRNQASKLLDGEIVCANVTNGVQCADCNLCNGATEGDRRKIVAIPVHGTHNSGKWLEAEKEA